MAIVRRRLIARQCDTRDADDDHAGAERKYARANQNSLRLDFHSHV
jgi:hypothetical protein